MKAKIISQKVYDSMMEWKHRHGYEIKRLVVEEANNLAITLLGSDVYARTGFEFESERHPSGQEPEVLGEIEVPDEIVEKALALVRAQEELNSFKDVIEALLS